MGLAAFFFRGGRLVSTWPCGPGFRTRIVAVLVLAAFKSGMAGLAAKESENVHELGHG